MGESFAASIRHFSSETREGHVIVTILPLPSMFFDQIIKKHCAF